MLNSNAERNATRIRRKPVDSMVYRRKKVAVQQQPKESLVIHRRKEVVIRRPVKYAGRNVATATPVESDNTNVHPSVMQQRQPAMTQKINVAAKSTPKPAQQQSHPVSDRVRKIMVESTRPAQQPTRPTAQEMKQTAISQAIAKAAKKQVVKKHKMNTVHFGFKRILLATVCAAVAVFAIVYFVNLNAPNISLKVAAMQSGIEASYPAYVPRDFNLSDITSENGKITLNFKNGSTGDAFTLVEEKSSWDSNALLNNFVRETYGDNYTMIREQGLTLYISGSNASWVNGGVVYKLKTISGTLTKKQIKSIAVSL